MRTYYNYTMNSKKNTIRKILLLTFVLFAVFGTNYKEVKADENTLFNSYVSGNAWYIGTIGSPVACPTGSPNIWEMYINEVLIYTADPFFCTTAPWITNLAGEGLSDGDVYKYLFYNGINPLGYISLTYTGGQYIVEKNLSEITSFTYDLATTSQLARITGYWNASSTTGLTEQIQFYIYSDVLGQEFFRSYTATTTGNFDFTFEFAPPYMLGATTTSLFTLNARLYEKDSTCPLHCDPFSKENGTKWTLLDTITEQEGNYAYTPPPDKPREEMSNLDYCKLLNFDMGFCAGAVAEAIFVPTDEQWKEVADTIREGVLEKWPLGYVTDFFTILSTTTVGTLTVIDATIPRGLGLGTGHYIRLDLNNVLDPYLYATTSQFFGDNPNTDSTATLYDITSGYWKIFVYLGALLYMLARIIGAGLIPSVSSSALTTETQAIDRKGKKYTITRKSRSQNYTNRN